MPQNTSLDFIRNYNPKIQEIYNYLDRKRHGRRMLSCADIDPIEISTFLPSVILVDIEHDPFRLLCRLV